MSKKIRKWIKSKKLELKENQNFIENINVNNYGTDAPEDAELDILNSQMKMLLSKMKNIIAKTGSGWSKNKGYAILHDIGKSIQDAMNITDANMRKAVVGQLPNQKN